MLNNTTSSSSPRPSFLDLLTFIGGLAMAYGFGWSTKDLIWGFWTASLVSGFAIQIYMKLAPEFKKDKNAVEWTLTAIGMVFGMAFFTVHFGAFHYLYAALLDLLMPLIPHPDRVYVGKLTWRGDIGFAFFDTFWIAVTSYWPFAIVSIVHDYQTFPTVAPQNQYFEPYKKILKIFFLMFLLGGMYELGLESFFVFALILVLYFAPNGLWGWIFSTLTGKNKKAAANKAAAQNPHS